MSVIKELFKPSAAKLAESVADLKAECQRLQAEVDQYEAAAVDASADPVAYGKASAQVAKVKAQLADQGERLSRLCKAHADAVDREQRQYVERLSAALTDARSALQGACEVTSAERSREEERHTKALAEIATRKAAAENAVSRADSRLSDAKAGLTEADATRLDELRAEIVKVREVYESDTLQAQYRTAHAVYLSAEHRFKEAEALVTNHGRSKGMMDQAAKERDAAKTEADRLQARVSEMNAELKSLTEQSAAIRGKITKR
jgi:hypothetical protein